MIIRESYLWFIILPYGIHLLSTVEPNNWIIAYLIGVFKIASCRIIKMAERRVWVRY